MLLKPLISDWRSGTVEGWKMEPWELIKPTRDWNHGPSGEIDPPLELTSSSHGSNMGYPCTHVWLGLEPNFIHLGTGGWQFQPLHTIPIYPWIISVKFRFLWWANPHFQDDDIDPFITHTQISPWKLIQSPRLLICFMHRSSCFGLNPDMFHG